MKRWSFDPGSGPGLKDLREITTLILDGGIALLPTDTIYGLHGLASSTEVVARIGEIKGRDAQKPFIVLASSASQLEEMGVTFPTAAARDLTSLWPGPLTMILPAASDVAAARGARSLAVRIPDVRWLRGMMVLTGPLVSTSANRSGEPAIHHPSELASEVLSLLDGVADVGMQQGEPSVIVDFTGTSPEVVRRGNELFTQEVWKTLRISL